MNLDNVKYPWMLIKFKENGTEILMKNAERLPEGRLGRIQQMLAMELHNHKKHARNKGEVATS